MMLNIKGKAIPVPIPWAKRPNNKIEKLGAMISITTPAIKQRLATINNFFSVKRRFKNEEIGTVAATTNK